MAMLMLSLSFTARPVLTQCRQPGLLLKVNQLILNAELNLRMILNYKSNGTTMEKKLTLAAV